MKESDLYLPVRDWLRSRGFTVHIEIFDADVVGIDEAGKICVVELKRGLTDGLYEQMRLRALWADEVWAAIPPVKTKPKSGWNGYGLLIVRDGKVKVQRNARPQPWHWHKSRTRRRKVLAKRRPAADHHIAGLPSCAQMRIQHEESFIEKVCG